MYNGFFEAVACVKPLVFDGLGGPSYRTKVEAMLTNRTNTTWRVAAGGLLGMFAMVSMGCSSAEENQANADNGRRPVNAITEVGEPPPPGSDWVAELPNGSSVEIRSLGELHLEPASADERFRTTDPGVPFCVDSETGKTMWRAMVCKNPDCAGDGNGGPRVFVTPINNPPLLADGSLNRQAWDRMAIGYMSKIVCPGCNSGRFVAEYHPVEVEQRRAELKEQLAAARHARQEAHENGETFPPSRRTPADIMRELDALPRLYLVP